MPKISLRECENAKVLADEIFCCKGHHLGARKNGKIGILRLKRGEPLVYKTSQQCADFDSNGNPIQEEERGW